MQPLETKNITPQRHFLAVFFISFMWGAFGVDRMYLGKWGTGILKLITFGGVGVWTIIDLILIMSGSAKDKQGRELLQFQEYKKFAYWTVLIFAIVIGVIILLAGVFIVLAIAQLFEMLYGGGLDSLLNGSIPDLDMLRDGSPIPPELEQYY